jgi:hypothetical protein
MRSFIKLAFGISVLSLAAISAPACGGDDDSGGSSGSGGGGTGGTAGSATGGAGGADGGVTCGSTACESWKIGGIIPMGACCTTDDKCGGEVTSSLGTLIGSFPVGCYGLDQPGTTDCGCPSYPFVSPLDNTNQQFNGCCATSGECGFAVDFTSKGGPNFGCIPLTQLGQTAVTCTPGSETAPPPDPEGGEGDCPLGAAGAGGTGGMAGGGGTAGAVSDAGTD